MMDFPLHNPSNIGLKNWNLEKILVLKWVIVSLKVNIFRSLELQWLVPVSGKFFWLVFVTLSTSLFMFHLISFTPHLIIHVASHFLQSTLHWSCFIFISFSSQSISFISPTTVHLVHIYFIWLYSCYMFIQPHCHFHFSANPVSANWRPTNVFR